MIQITGYHGTASINKDSILNNGFNLSIGLENEQWLGDGAYFFCEGVPPAPFVSAEKWAVVEAWDNNSRSYKYTEYVILTATISTKLDHFLDLTSNDGLEIFNYLREKYVESIRKAQKRIIDRFPKDGHIINDAISEGIIGRVDVVKGNFYIKLTKEERTNKISFRTPNCTILAIRNVNCIDSQSITVYKEHKL